MGRLAFDSTALKTPSIAVKTVFGDDNQLHAIFSLNKWMLIHTNLKLRETKEQNENCIEDARSTRRETREKL